MLSSSHAARGPGHQDDKCAQAARAPGINEAMLAGEVDTRWARSNPNGDRFASSSLEIASVHPIVKPTEDRILEALDFRRARAYISPLAFNLIAIHLQIGGGGIGEVKTGPQQQSREIAPCQRRASWLSRHAGHGGSRHCICDCL